MSGVDRLADFAQDSYSCYSTWVSPSDAVIPSSKFMAIDTTKTEIEVPVFLLKDFYQGSQLGIVCSLPIMGAIYKSMVGSILSDVSRCNCIAAIYTNKGETYYGCKGFLLDQHFEPLFLTTVCFKRLSVNELQPTGIKLRIAQDVFNRQEELIPKTIVKKLLPYYCTTPIESVIAGYHTLFTNVRPEIIIGKMDNIVQSIATPSPSTASDAYFNELLNQHIDDL